MTPATTTPPTPVPRTGLTSTLQPTYHPERLIIVDADSIESPETVTLRYEEEAAARANGGDRRGSSPSGHFMAAYAKPQLPQMHCTFSLSASDDLAKLC